MCKQNREAQIGQDTVGGSAKDEVAESGRAACDRHGAMGGLWVQLKSESGRQHSPAATLKSLTISKWTRTLALETQPL
jgi:hypothetical protein